MNQTAFTTNLPSAAHHRTFGSTMTTSPDIASLGASLLNTAAERD